MSIFFHELRRRNVFRVAAAYAIVAWLLIQIAVNVFPTLQLPSWATTLVTMLLILGFPVALLLAWAFELTPDGIKLSQPVPKRGVGARGRALDYVLIGGLVLLAASMLATQIRSGEDSRVSIADGRRPSIAVLPFVDLSPAGDQEYFGDGIAEQLLNELARLDGIDVASRTSSFAYKGSGTGVPEIGRELGVAAVLEGSIRLSGDTRRVTAQLIDVESGYHIFSNTYDYKTTDVFAMQEDIAMRVAGALGVQFGIGGANAFIGAGTDSIEAYENYLRSLSTADEREKTRLLRRAVEVDPGYAAAWAELGLVTVSRVWQVVPSEMPAVVEAARPLVERAVELDPQSADGHALLGTVHYAANEWLDAQASQDRAIALSRTRQTLGQNGNLMMRAGRSSEALAQWDAADAVSRFISDTSFEDFRFFALIALDRFEEARALLPELAREQRQQAAVLLALSEGAPEDVRAAITASTTPRVAATNLYEPLLEVFDERDKALHLLHELDERTTVTWPSKWNDIGNLAAYFGDAQFAFELAAESALSGSPRRFTLWMPFMEQVRRLPEFKQIVTEMGLVEYWRKYGWTDHCRPLGDTDFTCT